MKTLAWITVAALALLAFFAVSNWNLITAPAALNFVGFTVQGPLGLILLGATLIFITLFALYSLFLRTSALLEMRRHLKELAAQRELAEKAEASRFTALGAKMEQEFSRVRDLLKQQGADALRRSDTLETSLLNALNESANSIFAHLGQIDDKLNSAVKESGNSQDRGHKLEFERSGRSLT